MSQHDYVIANQTFPNFRTDLNSAFAASVSQNSGASAPSTTYAYQLWYDTGNDILKMRNAADDAWIELFTVDQTADTASAPSVAAGSNLIINGNMAVSQRGVSTSFAHDGTTNTYTVDRFEFTMSNNHETFDCTVAQDSDAPDGFSNCMKVTTGTEESSIASDEYVFLRQRIEGQNLQHLKYGTSAAVSTTVSFYVKSSVTGTFGITMYSADGSRNIGTTYTINSANTWEYKTLTFGGDVSGTINNDNGDALNVIWHLSSGSDFDSTDNTSWGAYSTGRWAYGHAQDGVITTAGATFQITGVQLEVGSVANPVFQHESFAETLQKCQRYYQKSYALGTVAGTATLVGREILQASGSTLSTTTRFTTEMRATPTVTCFGPQTGATGIDISGSNSVGFTLGNQSPTSFRVAKASTPVFLSYHFSAEAEL